MTISEELLDLLIELLREAADSREADYGSEDLMADELRDAAGRLEAHR